MESTSQCEIATSVVLWGLVSISESKISPVEIQLEIRRHMYVSGRSSPHQTKSLRDNHLSIAPPELRSLFALAK